MIRGREPRRHRNYVYVIETKVKGKWVVEWDCGTFLSYEIGEVSMKERETYIQNPKKYRLTMYISEKPLDGGFW
jgi:hypothetical protein